MNIAFETANPRLQNILSRLKGVKKVGPNTYRAYSPLRDEKEPSLYITEKSDGTILMCDHGGGDTKATLAAIGLTMCILFPSGGSEGSGPKGPAPSRKVAAIYKYLDKNGELVAEKVRYTNKNFFWRSKKPDGSYDYHKPENVPLYNGMVLEDVKPFLLYRVEKEPTMERRKDKNNHVLKDGESYREKEHRYMYRWVDSDKKRHCTYAQTLRELRKKEAEINRNKSDGISSAGSNLRLDDVYNLWKKNKVGLKQSTYVNYLYMYEHFIGPKIGKMKIKDIRKSTVLGLYNDLTRSNDIGKTMAINTLEVIHNVLRQVLQVAVDDDYIRKNPTEGVLREVKKANNYERPKRKALTLEQQNAFIRFLKSKPLYYSWSILFAVLLGTGCRIAEFIGLRWCDIDWKNNTISINHNLVYRQHTDGKCYFSVTTPKTSAGCRTIPMMKDVRRALEDEKIRQQELGVRCTTVIDGYTDFAFFNRFGQPHNPAAINREIDRLVLAYNAQEMEKAAEENRTPVILPDFSCHQLRHTFCTRYCEIEPNIKVIQEVMGHKDIKTTMEIYAEAQKELKERSVQNISGKFDVY